jgi:hypothetical protein
MTSLELQQRLAAFFPADEVGYKPQTVRGDDALVAYYIDARTVMDRLDSVVGVDGWTDDYTFLDHGSVLCRLSVRINGEWVSKEDTGSESEQPDAGDRLKAAVSDALKRAAVKFGVGRYLYSLPKRWHPYDAQKKRFKTTPPIPAAFLPPENPGPPIDSVQAGAVRQLLAETGANEAAFLRYFGVPSVEAIPEAKYLDVMAALEKKAKTAQQGVPLREGA